MFGRSTKKKSGESAALLVIGLGNPGEKYAGTRHNVGAEVVAELARRQSAALKPSKEQALVAEIRINQQRVALAFPQTFMNESGQAVQKLVRRHGIEEPQKIVVIHDELDLPVGSLKVKSGGGLAGHNGLKSITAHLHTQDYLRVRIGIGRPPGRQSAADHVLRRPGKAEGQELATVILEAADAVELILDQGVEAAMGQINTRS
ncbi:MAG TPA: aminoacyl-tRNA hydrolase [Acidimicrobiia bacterium]|jgi:peptidyl-tRNA hydrolase (EC 3.1.1.29)|nr:aminoacyl-tRNA hydrolase [Acidimicrobiia bacterium]HIL46401.1 aminoacyl-tRNA hydrolase [Acidimicrobiia bacterium]